jgi:antibiotic biosynthesis monooxygenase (ABM) superfamily enzyme
MVVEGIGKKLPFGLLLIGLATLAIPSAVLAQQDQPGQPGQQPQQPQQQPPQQQQQDEQRAGEQDVEQRAGQQDVDVAVAPGEAREEQPQWNAVRIIRVKGERRAEFEALLKELAAAMTEANMPPYNVWQVELGELNTYHIAGALESFSEFEDMEMPMDPAEMAVWVNRIESTIDSHHVRIAQIHPDLSMLPDMQGGEPPPLLMLLSQTVLPGKSQEYQTWVRDEVLPALRQSDVLGMVSNQIVFGGDNRMWVFAVPLASWSELDQPSPLHRSMGEQAAEELLMRGDQMVERGEWIVLRLRPDLSAAAGGA